MSTTAMDTPVGEIEGVGPRTAQLFAAMGVYTASDLLRASAEGLHGAVRDVASLDEVRRWRAMAAFLQVAGMTNQWAEALAVAPFTSMQAIHHADHGALRDAFDTALASGVTPDAPDELTLAELRRDIAVLVHTGAVNVTVRDESDAPVVGASLRVGVMRATTDARGRARITRIPLGRRTRLVVEQAGFAPAAVDLDAPLLDESHLGVKIVRLAPAEAGLAAGAAPATLSEYEGDVLPALSEHAMTSETRDGAALRERDVLMLRRFHENGTTAQVTSKFLEYRDGTFVAVSFRVERALLPPNALLRQHFQVRGGRLEPVAMNATRLDFHKAMRRARAAMAGRPPAQTIAERDARMHEYAELVVAHRAWSPRLS